MLFVEQIYKLYKRQDGIENGKPHACFPRYEPGASAYIRTPT